MGESEESKKNGSTPLRSKIDELWEEVTEAKERGDLEQALTLAKDAVSLAEEELGPYHPKAIENLITFGGLQAKGGYLKEAVQTYVNAKGKVNAALYDDHPLMALIYSGLADVNLLQGLGTEAEALYKRAIVAVENSLGKTSPALLPILTRLEEFYTSHDDFHKARIAADLKRGILINLQNSQEEARFEDEMEIIDPFVEEMESVLTGAPAAPEKFIDKSTEMLQVSSFFNSGMISFESKDYASAILHFSGALSLLETTLGEQHRELIPVLEQLATACEALGREDQAKNLKNRMAKIQAAV